MSRASRSRVGLWWCVGAMAVAFGAGTVNFACSSEDESEHGRAGTPTAVAAFATSDACLQCGADALQGACKAEADACLQSPACADVGGCVLACAPADLMCVTACLQAAASAFEALATCVACNACAAECQGDWGCGSGGAGGGGNAGGMGGASSGSGGGSGGAGGDPGSGSGGGGPIGACDGSGCCEDCAACASNGPCAAALETCFLEPECLVLSDCVSWCDPSDAACVDDCKQMFPSGAQAFDAAYGCVVCSECPGDCQELTPLCP